MQINDGGGDYPPLVILWVNMEPVVREGWRASFEEYIGLGRECF